MYITLHKLSVCVIYRATAVLELLKKKIELCKLQADIGAKLSYKGR